MSSTDTLNRWHRSVAVRLSLWFALLFAAGVSALFLLLYLSLGRHLEARDSEALQLRLQQYADIYEARGLFGLRERIAEDSVAPNVRSLFVRLIGPRGDVVWGRVPPDWIAQDAQRVAVPDGWGGWTVRQIYTVRVPRDQEQDLAVVSAMLADGLLLQVARSTDNRSALLEPLRRTFLQVAAPVVLAGFAAGVWAARRATRPLHNVVETARRIIATGTLEARVPLPDRKDDIAELVLHFNTVLDKNAALLRTMREALDNVAHDLRTPLTSLRGAAELALQQPDDEGAVRDALANCIERTDEVLRLLRALMEISEAEAGMLRLDRQPCDLGQLTKDVAELYTDVAEAKSLILQVDIAGPLPVVVDPLRLRPAIANLVDNAVKYTPAGGRVQLRARVEGGQARVEVHDTGPGIDPAEQPRIWERLYRGDRSRSESGLGLGLSLVRAIVEAHGGQVSVDSTLGRGSVFVLTLPLMPAEESLRAAGAV